MCKKNIEYIEYRIYYRIYSVWWVMRLTKYTGINAQNLKTIYNGIKISKSWIKSGTSLLHKGSCRSSNLYFNAILYQRAFSKTNSKLAFNLHSRYCIDIVQIILVWSITHCVQFSGWYEHYHYFYIMLSLLVSTRTDWHLMEGLNSIESKAVQFS